MLWRLFRGNPRKKVICRFCPQTISVNARKMSVFVMGTIWHAQSLLEWLEVDLSARPAVSFRVTHLNTQICERTVWYAQGLLDWLEVDLSARPAVSLRVICVLKIPVFTQTICMCTQKTPNDDRWWRECEKEEKEREREREREKERERDRQSERETEIERERG